MAQSEGIIIERTRGRARYAHIDLKRYGEQLKEFFLSNGIEIDEKTSKLQKDLQNAAKDVRLHKQGKLKLKTAQDLLDEL